LAGIGSDLPVALLTPNALGHGERAAPFLAVIEVDIGLRWSAGADADVDDVHI